MKTLEIESLPDEIFAKIERVAQESGKPTREIAAEFHAQALARDEAEASLLALIQKEREELRQKGVYINDEDSKAAIEWGRE